MADTVQHFLEQMIPELEELQTSGVFSGAEVKAIVSRRRELEYAVKRQGKERVDFLRYLQYEQRLERLRRLRMTRLGLRSAGRHADSGGVKRMHTLFRRALARYGGDVRLWLQYVDFALHVDSTRALSRIFGEALALHPHEPSLWLLAAAWEWKHNANARASRVLLQRALRLNPRVPELYLEYARFELLYAQKLRDRHELRGSGKKGEEGEQGSEQGIDLLSVPGGVDEAGQVQGDDTQGDGGQGGHGGHGDAQGQGFLELSQGQGQGQGTESDVDATLSARMVQAIFDAACRALPDDSTLALKFIVLLRSFPHSESVVEHAYAHLRSNALTQTHSAHSAALVCRQELDACLALVPPEFDAAFDEPYVRALGATCDSFESLLSSESAPQGLEREYLLFLLQELPHFTREHHVNDSVASDLRSRLLAHTTLVASERVEGVLLKARVLLSLEEDVTRALALMRAATEHPELRRSASPWLVYSQLLARSASSSSSPDPSATLSLLTRALSACRGEAVEEQRLYEAALGHSLRHALPFASVRSLLDSALLLGDSSVQSSLRVRLVALLEEHSVAEEHARLVLERLCSVLPVSGAVFLACLRYLERSHLSASSSSSSSESSRALSESLLRSLLEQALRDPVLASSSDAELWLLAVRFHLRRGELRRVHDLHARALRSLAQPERFLLEYQALASSAQL